MVAKLKAAGAYEVLQHGANIKEADAYLKEHIMPLAAARGEEPVYVSPFDHPDIWEGHATMVDEMHDQFTEMGEDAPDVIVCSCGGGGLFNGLMEGISNQITAAAAADDDDDPDNNNKWSRTQILAVNTIGANALAHSLAAGRNTSIARITSIATSLGLTRISDHTFKLFTAAQRAGRAFNAVLTDAEAAMGCWRFAEEERMLVEPACGVNVALCYGQRLKKALGRPVRRDEKVVIVVCGGNNVTAGLIEGWKREFGGLVEEGLTGGFDEVLAGMLAVQPPVGHHYLLM